jgi:hypothetical protein
MVHRHRRRPDHARRHRRGGALRHLSFSRLYRVDNWLLAEGEKPSKRIAASPISSSCRSASAKSAARLGWWSTGAHAIYIEGLSIRSESVAETRGRRPWVPERARSKPSLSAGQAYAAILALPMMTMMMMMPSIASSTAIPMSEA